MIGPSLAVEEFISFSMSALPLPPRVLGGNDLTVAVFRP